MLDDHQSSPGPSPALGGGGGFLSGERKGISSQRKKEEGWIMINGQIQARGEESLAVAPLSLHSASARSSGGAGLLPLRSLCSALKGHLGSCHVGKYGQSPLSSLILRHQSRDQETLRVGHPDAVHVNSRPFCAKKATPW